MAEDPRNNQIKHDGYQGLHIYKWSCANVRLNSIHEKLDSGDSKVRKF